MRRWSEEGQLSAFHNQIINCESFVLRALAINPKPTLIVDIAKLMNGGSSPFFRLTHFRAHWLASIVSFGQDMFSGVLYEEIRRGPGCAECAFNLITCCCVTVLRTEQMIYYYIV